MNTMEYYSAIGKIEITSFAGKLMELGEIIASKLSQTRKASTTCFYSHMEIKK